MKFDLDKSIEILERTPTTIYSLLNNISEDWVLLNEGNNSWSAFDVLGHLIHGEKTDWIPRVTTILSNNSDKSFPPYDRLVQFKNSNGKTMEDLLEEFVQLRKENIQYLKSKKITTKDLEKKRSSYDIW
ncbi:hypothetical protein SLW70_10275 [Flavobacterium sp. NG2]|uniref:DinB family protein n=1 Tax=Flavobacterium sp. NG2 TaxID=3097547 RepID=UPI002A816CF3|nr:DinB family protein [Flavobacterium sp. NG2]WPR70328.1 hypothetical protein SLW70_10275 [Flavobacterium sp. NG2]